MSSYGASVAQNDDLVKETLKISPERVDLRVTGLRADRYPVERIVREKDELGHVVTTVESVLDEEGKQLFTEVEIVEYEIIRGDTKCGGEARLDQITSINLKADSDDYAANIAKARAASIMAQVDQIRSGEKSPLPDGHLPLRMWGGLSEHVIKVLEFNKIFSVQQLRDLTPAQTARLPGGLHAERMQSEARAYLLRQESVMAQKRDNDIIARLEKSEKDNEELQQMMKTLLKKIGADDDDEGKAEESKSDTPVDVEAEKTAIMAEANAQRKNRHDRVRT